MCVGVCWKREEEQAEISYLYLAFTKDNLTYDRNISKLALPFRYITKQGQQASMLISQSECSPNLYNHTCGYPAVKKASRLRVCVYLVKQLFVQRPVNS